MESYKTKSRIVTCIATVTIAAITYISTMNPDQLATYLGMYGNYAPLIIVICASIINQVSEEKRVNRAEEIVNNDYTKLGYPRLNKDEINVTNETEVIIPEQSYLENNEEINTTKGYTGTTTTDVKAEKDDLEPVEIGDDTQ